MKEEKIDEKFECGDCGCYYWVADRNEFNCPNCNDCGCYYCCYYWVADRNEFNCPNCNEEGETK